MDYEKIIEAISKFVERGDIDSLEKWNRLDDITTIIKSLKDEFLKEGI
ncbi:hypothetical protein LCGC14_0653460 [marine sediment metagenome]|uniref:Uncharacterized protein n=1 Tax=marine sediment metagenome TaxID=412755 RepID=A0A0F9R0X5_9ZZZZ